MFQLKINNTKPKDWPLIPLIIHNQMCYYEYMIPVRQNSSVPTPFLMLGDDLLVWDFLSSMIFHDLWWFFKIPWLSMTFPENFIFPDFPGFPDPVGTLKCNFGGSHYLKMQILRQPHGEETYGKYWLLFKIVCASETVKILQRQHECYGASNHWQRGYLFNNFFWLTTSLERWKLYITGPLWGESTGFDLITWQSIELVARRIATIMIFLIIAPPCPHNYCTHCPDQLLPWSASTLDPYNPDPNSSWRFVTLPMRFSHPCSRQTNQRPPEVLWKKNYDYQFQRWSISS